MARLRRPADATQTTTNSGTQQPVAREANSDQPVGRRHALRAVLAGGLGALGAVLLGTRRPDAAQASSTNGSLWLTSAIPATGSLATIEGDITSSGGYGLLGSNTAGGIGVFGGGTGNGSIGVVGQTNANGGGILGPLATPAVQGTSSGLHGIGVMGEADSGVGAFGVYGVSNSGAGVVGQSNASSGPLAGVFGGSSSPSGYGVQGYNPAGGVAVQGQSDGSSNSSIGVRGDSSSSSGGIGVLGVSSNDIHSIGLYGISATGTGFYGYSGASGGVGAAGVNTTAGIGLYGQSAGGYAGVFSGAVYITGAMTVHGAKSAAVRGADGGLKRMYSVESPESWFEDFGSGQLSGGMATVQLEPGFAAVVKTDNYRVFPVANGDCKGLYVSGKTPSSFTIHELQGGTSSIAFDYRVVAKRKDIVGVRLEHVDEPPVIDVPKLPEPPPAPAKLALPTLPTAPPPLTPPAGPGR